jgi:hypothetical protein
MKTYYILWTYIANYSERLVKVQANNPEEALKNSIGYFSEDFRKKATVYVFESPPVLEQRKGELLTE